MIAREIFDQLPALLAALMGGAKPLNNPFEDATKRMRSACSDCGACSSLCMTRHAHAPNMMWLDSFLVFSLAATRLPADEARLKPFA
jgi:hypothetical protein